MKKLLFALPILFALSCGDTNNESKTSATTEDHSGHNHSANNHGAEDKPISYKTHDPICKMERDEAWTIVSVYEGDTVKFCSEPCKTTFDKNPARHTANK